ncbi:MAG: hypothetical protein HZA28_06775 [Candidatus Omnitrophica bacterium]|nr:hypothetical protein [Candidatus Omnitrophota bacterium]
MPEHLNHLLKTRKSQYNVGLTIDREEEFVKNFELLYGDSRLVAKLRDNGLSVVKDFDREHLTHALAEILDKIL